jgi:AAA+ superfamily predicted ATPase
MDTPEQKKLSSNYKYRDMKVHSSDEWMAGSTKKYRKVFDRYETTWMRVELSFFNKLFDEEDWEASVRTKCFFVNGSQKNEISNFEEKRKISKEENIVYIRHSWGNAVPGAYWVKGNYVWEGYIDEVKVGEAIFYIEDIGVLPPGENHFFDIDSIRLFEGDATASTLPQKKYVRKFSQKETHYIWAELNFKNKIAKDYYTEIVFNFYDADGLPKGSQNYVTYIPPNTSGVVYTAYAGWGSPVAGTWYNDSYVLEIVFMDTLIASVPFQVGESFEEGPVEAVTAKSQLLKFGNHISSSTNESAETILNNALEELNALTGMDKIKMEVNEMVKLVKFYQETGKDVLNRFSLHTVFTGNPGTGKTTVARILSRIYKGLGILEKGHLVEVDREGLVAGYVGQTAIKTNEKITEAMGGILFIDEAYSLAQERGSPYDFGGEAIQIILKRMEDMRGKFGVIVAGYPQKMHQFIHSNPGLRSRFDKYFVFEDYTPDEMFTIAIGMYLKDGVVPDVEAATHLKNYFAFLFKNRDEHFGNARTVRQVVAESIKNQHLRLAAMKKEERTPDLMGTVIMDDVREFEMKDVGFGQPKIGFKLKDD